MKSRTRVFTCIVLLGVLALTLCVPVGAATTGWSKTYGQTGQEYWAASVIQTSDGGYAIVGTVESFSVNSTKHFFLLKTDSSGNMLWNKTYAGATDDTAYSGVQTSPDGGYALAGITENSSSSVRDCFLVKTDSSGNMLWNKTYGDGDAWANSVVQTSDGGYALAGSLYAEEIWLVKTDSNGNMQWNQTCGPELIEAFSLTKTSDGGYALAGGDGTECTFVKTDSYGNTTWYQTYGSTQDEKANSVIQTSDGGYALAGDTGSDDSNPNSHDGFLLIKTDSSGVMLWDQTYGGITTEDFANSVVQTNGGGYAIAGVTENLTFLDDHVWLVQTDVSGSKQWDMKYGVYASGYSVVQTGDGGYAIAGISSTDLLLVKTDANGAIPEFPPFVAVPLFTVLATLAVLVYKRRTAKSG